MNRTQLAVLAAAGTAAAVAWGVVLVEHWGNGAGEVATALVVSRPTVAPSVDSDAGAARATVPAELRVPTIAPGSGGTPRGGVVKDAAGRPTAVGAAFVQTMWTCDTRIDSSSRDAAARSVRWATEQLGAALTRPATRTTPQWDEWARHDAYARVGVVRAPTLGQDVDTYARLRTYRVELGVVGNDGYSDRLEPFLVTVTLVRQDGFWLVEGIALT